MRHSSATEQPAEATFRIGSLISRSTLRRLLSLTTIIICTFNSAVLPQRTGFTLQTCETEIPLQEDTNSNEEETERLPTTSVRCKSKVARCFRQNNVFGSRQSRPDERCVQIPTTKSYWSLPSQRPACSSGDLIIQHDSQAFRHLMPRARITHREITNTAIRMVVFLQCMRAES